MRARGDLGDLRLLDESGHEVPFVVDRLEPRKAELRWAGHLAEAENVRRRHSAWTVDLGAPRDFDRVELSLANQSFATRVLLETSIDGADWTVASPAASVFDRVWGASRIRHTHIDLPQPIRARWLRLTANEHRTVALALQGVEVVATHDLARRGWTRGVTLRRASSQAGTSRYRVEAPPGLPIERLQLATTTALFFRHVTVKALRQHGARRDERVVAEADVYRISLSESDVSGESVMVDLGAPVSDPLVLEVADADSPPLEDLSAVAQGDVTRLIFSAPEAASSRRLTLVYGNALARPPVYDISHLKDRLAFTTAESAAVLEQEVQRHAVAGSQATAAKPHLGARLDTRPWRHERRLDPVAEAGLYALSLKPEDLAELRPDLADVRLVDDARRQVPYVLDRSATRAWVALHADVVQALRKGDGRRVTRATLTWDDERALPLQALELSFSEDFFARPMRLLGLAVDNPRHREQMEQVGTLRRAPQDDTPLTLALRGHVVQRLVLEIEDGDDAPLHLERASAAVDLPQIVFLVDPGAYRLLLGNPRARAPVYEIAAERAQILDGNAIPVAAGPLLRNQDVGFMATLRSLAGSDGALGSGVLLVTLLVACATLVALVLRIVRRQPAPPQ